MHISISYLLCTLCFCCQHLVYCKLNYINVHCYVPTHTPKLFTHHLLVHVVAVHIHYHINSHSNNFIIIIIIFNKLLLSSDNFNEVLGKIWDIDYVLYVLNSISNYFIGMIVFTNL